MRLYKSSYLKAFQEGEHLEDDELEILMNDMKTLSELCYSYGEMFIITGNYAFTVSDNCKKYLENRRANKEKK